MRHRLLRLVIVVPASVLVPATAALANPTPARLPAHAIALIGRDISGQAGEAAAPVPPPRAVTVAGVTIDPGSDDDSPRIVKASAKLQCVTFARALSGIDIRGNAATWWTKAKGAYAKLTTPKPGAVMVFARRRTMPLGHVAVVKEVVSPREVRIDHANWDRHGEIYLNAPVVDVSRNNDWSEVRVWNAKLGVMGSHTYHLSGFVAD